MSLLSTMVMQIATLAVDARHPSQIQAPLYAVPCFWQALSFHRQSMVLATCHVIPTLPFNIWTPGLLQASVHGQTGLERSDV